MRHPSTDEVLVVAGLVAEAGVVHGFSTLALGNMRSPGPGAETVTAARRALASALGLDAERMTLAGAVHGAEVARVDGPSGVIRGVDALVTDRPGLPLLATFADCWPLVLYDPRRQALALIHAGWRGTALGVAGETVAALIREYGSRPADLVAGLGPGICGGCYEVGEEVATRFADGAVRPGATTGRFWLDLGAANRAHLEAAGLAPDRIHAQGTCTRESPELASHRRSPDGLRCACLVALR
jgi:YfiH family protein